MALLPSEQSEPCLKSELELFTSPNVQVAVQDGFWTEYHPLASLGDSSPIEFVVTGSQEALLDLTQSYLHVKAKVTNADGTNIAADAKVAPVNLALHSMFSQCDCFLNGKQVAAADNSYSYRAYIESLLSFGSDAKEGHLSGALWHADTPSTFNVIDPAAASKNHGFNSRQTFTAQSKLLDLYGRVHSDIFHQDRLLLTGVDLRLKLSRSKDAFVLMGAQADTYRLVVTHASLFVRKVRPAPSVLLAHNQTLSRTNAKYPLQRCEVKTFTIPKDSLQGNLDNVVLGSLPSMCLIGLVSNKAYNGAYNENPFRFHHYNVNHLCLHVDGRQVPSSALRPDFTNNLFVRSYVSLFQSIGKLSQDEGPALPYSHYSKGYTLYGFDLSSDLSSSQSHFNLVKQGNIRIDIRFKEPLPETVNLVLYLIYQTVLEIDKSRTVIYDY